MPFEFRHQPLLPIPAYRRRMLRFGGVALGMILGSLVIGIVGYRLSEGMAWIDALLNAAMILGGMGPVTALQTVAGKLFASFYALFSGVIFLAAVGVFLAPILHRFLHRFHIELPDQEEDDPG